LHGDGVGAACFAGAAALGPEFNGKSTDALDSLAVSPEPQPLSGSLLVTEIIFETGCASQLSVAQTLTVTSTSLRLGGESTFGLAAPSHRQDKDDRRRRRLIQNWQAQSPGATINRSALLPERLDCPESFRATISRLDYSFTAACLACALVYH
jgi:hypothetical protein